jgi:FixJ family two-component response regulator
MVFVQTGSLLRDDARGASPVCGQRDSSGTTHEMPTVFIVDGDIAACESLAALISREGWRPEIFASAEEFLSHPIELAPGCMILDVSLPGLSGLELQKRAASKCSYIPAVFLSTKEDIPTTVEAMKAGALEFLLKPWRDEDLLSALREALQRSRLATARETRKRSIERGYASLSLRERQVMALVSSGLQNKEVGNELGISEITVKAHRGQVMRKMQAASLADLVKMAGKLGLTKSREATMRRAKLGVLAGSGGLVTGHCAFVH